MRFATICSGALVLGPLLSVATGRADEKEPPVRWPQGLVSHLPPDGSWVRFELKMKGTFRSEGGEPKEFDMKGTLTLSSVGRVRDGEEDCRWIELKSELAPVGTPDDKHRLILKLLIPEKHLTRGEDPLAHVRRMYYARKGGANVAEVPIEKIEDDWRKRYEIERIRSLCPGVLKDPKKQPTQTLETKLGKLECERVTGTGELPKSPLRGEAEWAWKGQFEYFLSDKVPFGVAQLRAETEGYEKSTGINKKTTEIKIKTTRTLTVVETGEKATSDLPKGE